MPGANLTYDEAAQRRALLRLDSYEIDLDLSSTGETFTSTTVIRFDCPQPGSSTFADLVAPSVRQVILNGRLLDPQASYQDSRIALDDLAASNELRVVADCAYMNTGEGLHRSIDPADGRTYLYTQFEIPEARRVFATFEQPDLKATFTFTITAPSGWTVLSNSTTPKPEPLAGREDASIWRFAPTPRISTYIAAVIAGEFHQVQDTYTAPSGQVVPLAVLCRQSLAPYLDPDEIFEVTKQGFGYYLPLFGHPYPFEKYDQVFVPEYNIGAMENVGCVTFSERYLFRSKVTDARRQARAETILHELAHMWFGDLVTMRWWDDMWLKESVASYVSVRCLVEATRWREGWTAFANAEKAWGLRQDQMSSTHPIVATISDLEDVGLNFDGITYAKGAAALKQLVTWVGGGAFIAGLRTYIDRYAWGNTTLDDLLAVLAEASGRDLTSWAAVWLQTAGPNTLRGSYDVGPDGAFTSFAVLQDAPAEHPTLRPHRIAVGLYSRTDESLERVHRVEVDITGARTEVPALVGLARPDLVLLNDDDLTYATIRFDRQSLSTVVSDIGRLADPLARALCWTATWDMVRSAEMPARSFIRMVLDGIGGESDISVVQTLHSNLVVALRSYVDPPALAQAAAHVAAAARRWLTEAEPGDDLQLAWLRLFALVATGDADMGLLADLRNGTTTVAGLDIDTELRWALLTPLIRAGRAGADEIAAELDRDRTTAGEEYAEGALAARPTPDAKARAWASVIERDDLPNRTQDAIIGGTSSRIGLGFVQFSQPELLAPYVDPYFDALAGIWQTRTYEIARNIVAGLYPRWRIVQDTLDRTDSFLSNPDLAPALRRLVMEGRDDVVRSMRAQATDRAAGASGDNVVW
jgi:aminopeptidase N